MSVTVKECIKQKEWDNGKGQKVPIYKVELTDGTFGESFGKEIPIGTNASEITIEEGQYGKKFKWSAPKNGFPARAKTGNEVFAISYAKDVVVAVYPHMVEKPTSSDLAKVITGIADIFYNWMEAKKK